MTKVQAADLTWEQFAQLLRDLNRGPDAPKLRGWLEWPDGCSFDWWTSWNSEIACYCAWQRPRRKNFSTVVPEATAGRIFAPDGQLQWRVLPGERDTRIWRVVFIGSNQWWQDAQLAGFRDFSDQFSACSIRRCQYYLWGLHSPISPGEWVELRIPQRFSYPVEKPCRGVRIEVEDFLNSVGEVVLSRWCDLIPVDE